MFYLDTSALVNIVRPEPESSELRTWLASQPDRLLATSALAEVELVRALRRLGEVEPLPLVSLLLETILLIEVDAAVRLLAADLSDPLVRSLDALHIASAYQLRPDLSAIITYDQRMASAVDRDVAVVSPGAAQVVGPAAGREPIVR